MGPLKSFKLWHVMEQKLHDPNVSNDVKAQISALFGSGRQKKRARNELEKKADDVVNQKALDSGVTQEQLDNADKLKVGAILPAGWFQALIAALPKILAFIESILAMFGLTPKPVPPLPAPVTANAEGTDSTFVAHDKFHVDHAKHGHEG